MSDSLSRRGFLGAASGLAAYTVIGPGVRPVRGAPAIHIRPPSDNIVVASSNGIRGVQRAGELIAQGVDTLEAIVEGVKIQELDPNDTSVGYGGLPNEDGVVQLDSSCMHGPSRRAGAVGCLEAIKTPSMVAKYVLKYTDHVFLVGEGAKRFALSYGFREEELLTDRSRAAWLRWRANRDPNDDYLDVPRDEDMLYREHGTINMCAVNTNGDISSVTTTSGLSWKIPGRVGDSPIHGAGQYCDNDIGAAGSTGRGEACIKACGGFLTVENMRRGMSPTDAALETLRRVAATTEDALLDEQGRPTFGLSFYAVNKNGVHGGATMWGGGERTPRYAVWDGETARRSDLAPLYERAG